MPAPLVIHPPAQPQSPGPIHRKQVGSEPSHPRHASITAISPEKATPKTVAFMFPPEVEEVRSVCQSPSWEAYDRRKKEKKEERKERKDEKKMKQRAMEEERPRGRRLSKAPSPSPAVVPGLGERRKTEPVVSGRQAQEKPRPSSVLGIPRRKTEEIEKHEKPKKRSGSLTSVIRASFEIRRPSIDRDTGFIGGVKLDQKKQDFQQQVLEDQAKGNSKVHPALRKSFIGYGSFTPIKTPPQSPKEDKESRRAYPPISIKSACDRNPGLLKSAPPPPPKPDFTNMYLWSARANRGDESDNEFAVVDDTEDHRGRKIEKELPPVEPTSPHKEKGLYRSGGIYVKSTPPVSYQGQFTQAAETEKHGGAAVNESSGSVQLHQSKPTRSSEPVASDIRVVAASPPAKNKKSPDSASKPARSRRSSLTSLFSSTPDPPRKSSKRNSLVLGKIPGANDSPNSKHPPITLKDPQNKPDQMLPSSPPSIPYERTSAGAQPKMYSSESFSPVNGKWNIIDAVNAAFGRGLPHTSTASSSAVASPSREGPVPEPFEKNDTHASLTDDVEQLKKKRVSTSTPVILNVDELPGQKSGQNEPRTSVIWMPYTSSSEDDSYSDGPNSSIPSTPNTTPPQSEGGYPPSIHTFNKPRTNGHKRNDSGYTSGSSPQLLPANRFEAPSSTQTDSDSDFDPIDAAARKVLEAFNDTEQKHNEKARPRSSYYDRPGNRDSVKLIAPSPLSSSMTNLTPQTSPSPITPLSPGFPPISHKLATKPQRTHPTINTNIQSNDPVAKVFVECCLCKYYHDMPSKLYEAMANPESVLGSTVDLGYMGKVSMTVKCPWCKHEMSTKCCAGLAAMVYIKERLH